MIVTGKAGYTLYTKRGLSIAFFLYLDKKKGVFVIIEKIINNNIVKSTNKGQEVIVMGCGIGFGQKIGEEIKEDKIEKIYVMKVSKQPNKLEEILQNVSLVSIQITNDIVSYAKQVLNYLLSDNVYLTLCDHIGCAIERYENNILMKNALLNEIKRFYNDEYVIGLQALTIIEKHTKIKLPEDEAGFIAFHIVNASLNATGIQETREIMHIIHNIENIIKYDLNIELKEDSINYQRLITHLKFLAKRILENFNVNETKTDESFFILMKKQYKKEYLCVLKITEYIEKNYQVKLSQDEILFLMVHIRKLLND